MVFTRKITVIGNGTVKVTKNGILVGTATETTPFNYSAVIGDIIIRESVGSLIKWCNLQNSCNTDIIVSSTFIATSTPNQEYIYYFNTTTPPLQFTRKITINGNGSVKVTKNGTVIGTATETTPFNYSAVIGDIIIRESVGSLIKWCNLQGNCSTEVINTSNFISTSTPNQEYIYYFTTSTTTPTLSLNVVGNPLDGNLWLVEATVTPQQTQPNEYHVKFYVDNIYHHTEGNIPYTSFGDDASGNVLLSRFDIDKTYVIKVEVWNTLETILHDTKTINVTQTSLCNQSVCSFIISQ